MSPIPVILDVDTGIDDALALMLACRSPELDILGVTCVAGNVALDKVVGNTLTVLDTMGRTDLPVAAGYDGPLVQPHSPAAHVHGEDGLGDLGWPRSTRSPDSRHAVDFMAQALEASPEPVTLVALAPLTNLAGFVRHFPHLLPRIRRIVSMGGSMASGGNVTPAAEFNIWCDPEAAAVVYSSGAPITMYGLDVFRPVKVTAQEVEALAGAGKPWSPLLGELLRFFQTRFRQPDPGLGDAGTVATVIAPEHLKTRPHRVVVELSGVHTRGMTVVDQRTFGEDGATSDRPNADVAHAIDARACARLFVERLG